MSEATTIAAIGALVYEHPQLLPVLAEHVEDQCGMVLPHVLLSDIVRWTAERVVDERDVCASIWRWLDAAFQRGDDSIRNLVAASGVEMLPSPDEPSGPELRSLISDRLLRFDSWSRQRRSS